MLNRKRYLEQSQIDILFIDTLSAEYCNWDLPFNVAGGLTNLLSFVRDRGHKGEILFNLDYPIDPEKVYKRYIEETVSKRPLMIGFSPFQAINDKLPDIQKIGKIVKKIRAQGASPYVIIGGHFASFNHRELMRDFPWIDFVVRGEGEQALNELLSIIKAGRDPKDVTGLTYRKGRKIIINQPRIGMEEVDALPIPALDPLELAQKRGIPVSKYIICSSRGCYGNCSFCSIQSFYRIFETRACWRPRDPVKVVDEIESIINNYGCREFAFYDDNFIGPGKPGQERAVAIAQEILKRGLKIGFEIWCRPNDVRRETMQVLKSAGLKVVKIGVESGSDRALKTYSKGTTAAINREALRLLNELGIITRITFIFFNPYSNLQEIKDNIEFYKYTRGLNNVFWNSQMILSPLLVLSGLPIMKRIKADRLLHGNYLKGYSYDFQDKAMDQLIKVSELFFLFYQSSRDLAGFMFTEEQAEIDMKNNETVIYDLPMKAIEEAVQCLELNGARKFPSFLRSLKKRLDQLLFSLEMRRAIQKVQA